MGVEIEHFKKERKQNKMMQSLKVSKSPERKMKLQTSKRTFQRGSIETKKF